MNKLLIHSNNTSFNKTDFFSISEQFVFDVDFDKDVDFYIDEKLKDGDLKQKLAKTEVVFIKVSLSQNYLEYLGLRLAYHIRLTKGLGVKKYIPIVFIAEESLQFLGLTNLEPSILFTAGIYLIKETKEEFQKVLRWFEEGRIKALEDYSLFVSTISINPPANYQSHHSIANEWSLARYFSMLKTEDNDVSYTNLREGISGLNYLRTLHFKYTEAKALRQKIHPKHTYTPEIIGVEGMKIGLIDDEIDKGWLAFYEYILRKSKAECVAFNGFRKEESREEVIERIQHWLRESIESSQPIDLFIIDLRLHDDDFSEENFDALAGVQIIKFIKEYNPGIQIVVSSASNKVWNYRRCLQYGVSDYTIKESPETFSTREETKQTLLHLSKQITEASEKAFLANFYRDIKYLNNSTVGRGSFGDREFENLVFEKKGLTDQIFNLLILDTKSEAIMNQCLLLAFQVLENYCDLAVVGSFGSDSSTSRKLSSGFIWSKSNSRMDIFINQPSQKISTRFELVSGKFDFQSEESNETPISFNVFPEMKIISSYKSGLDVSSLVKMISVLYFRDGIVKEDIEKIIKLRYYRSNVAAHLTNKVKPTSEKISSEDIVFFVSIFKRIFC